jgi:phage gp46-like protein
VGGLDRKIGPDGDYIDDGLGGYVETPTIQPAIRHQMKTERRRWVGDPAAGSDRYLYMRGGLTQANVNSVAEATRRALQVFIDAGEATDLQYESVALASGRLVEDIEITDVQGNTIQAGDMPAVQEE